MAVFRVEKNKGYTVMSNHHLRNKELTLKAKGLLSQMLSLPENWDYTLYSLISTTTESCFLPTFIQEYVSDLQIKFLILFHFCYLFYHWVFAKK
jgi:hypothetical protein